MQKPRSLVDDILIRRLKQVDNLSNVIFEAMNLPKEQHKIWVVSNMRQLTVMCEDSILATQIRMQQEAILDYFRKKNNLKFDELRIKLVAPERVFKPRANKATKHMPSITASKTIAAIADGIDDEELRESLLRLTGKKRQD
ncbi:MAG: Unknown protein [uncultured Thiotrichaceae bacterium]|uniref:DUF721 domain-containing protein n=1 Tax=uncultured Thiotrichaceae bacterium TaxID=298394 RepID=A0A6S6TDU3_9GAMM|nr:MAG: Unknown protein [uncultured Thiotrichaceae bacterium]